MYEFGTEGTLMCQSGGQERHRNIAYIVMEYVESDILTQMQSVGALGEETGRFFLNQILDALEYMHGKGIVHGDMKADNLLVDSKLNIKIADFGQA